MIRIFYRCLTALAACLLTCQAMAQAAYPSQNITIVLPFGPGSGTDIVTRLLAQKLSEGLGKPVVVDNKPWCQRLDRG